MIFSNIFGRLGLFKKVVARGADYKTTITQGIEGDGSIIKTTQEAQLDGSLRKLLGSLNFGPGLIAAGDGYFVASTETNFVQVIKGLLIEPAPGSPAPPSILIAETYFADPQTGDASWNMGGSLSLQVDGATGKETFNVNPQNDGDFVVNLDDLGKIKFTGTGVNQQFEITGLRTFADDTAAGVGGLTAGGVYLRTTGEIAIKL